MKRLLVGDSREELLTTLEIILRHWGYRVLASSDPADISRAMIDTSPDLLIIGHDFTTKKNPAAGKLLLENLLQSNLPVIALDACPESLAQRCVATLAIPVDLFELFSLVQRLTEPHPRQHLRLAVSLPGMVCQNGGGSQLAEVISISTRGLFIKTTFRMERDDHFRIIFPLLGLKRELDLEGRVVYRTEPGQENNYRQGVGIEFVSQNESEQQALKDFLEKLLIDELAVNRRSENLDPSQIRLHSEHVLRLVKSS